ncbi:hypothetical protein ACROYT_G014907 [Oculina patagonica]
MAVNHYQRGEFFRQHKLKQLENPEGDSANDNLETDSQDDQRDILSELTASKQKVRAHINSFLRQKSHYSRKDNRGKEYLEEGWSIQQMYYNYLDANEPTVLKRDREILSHSLSPVLIYLSSPSSSSLRSSSPSLKSIALFMQFSEQAQASVQGKPLPTSPCLAIPAEPTAN